MNSESKVVATRGVSSHKPPPKKTNDVQVIVVHDAPHIVPITTVPDSWSHVQAGTSLVIAILAFLFSLYVFASSRFHEERKRRAELFRRIASDFAADALGKLQEDTEAILSGTVAALLEYGGNEFVNFAATQIEESIGKYQDKLYRVANALQNRVDQPLRIRVNEVFDSMEEIVTGWLGGLVRPEAPRPEFREEMREILLDLDRQSTRIIREVTRAELDLYHPDIYGRLRRFFTRR